MKKDKMRTIMLIMLILLTGLYFHISQRKPPDKKIPITVIHQSNALIVTMDVTRLEDHVPVGLITIDTRGGMRLYNTIGKSGLATVVIPPKNISEHLTFIAIAKDYRGQAEMDVHLSTMLLQVNS